MTQVQTLAGKEIVIGITGSIAAVETIKLIHELRRKGAVIQVVMSPAATRIIHPDALAYASARPVITRLSGFVEHVSCCGSEGTADLLLIAPCTANTIGKIAAGIDDTPVTTFATTAIGSGIPVLVVPAMHESMFRHPAVRENLKRMTGWGVAVVPPRIEEDKAKIALTEEIVLWTERMIYGRPLAGKRVLITSGPCREPVDDIRVLTTRSAGQMGRELALQAFRLGAEVTVVHRDVFPCVHNEFADSAEEMSAGVIRHLSQYGADIYISAAAISDFAPMKVKGKIPSGKARSIHLNPLPKLLDEVISKFRPCTVAFKLGWDSERMAHNLLKRGVAVVVCNTPDTMGSGHGVFVVQTHDHSEPIRGSKEEAAAAIWNCVLAVHKSLS